MGKPWNQSEYRQWFKRLLIVRLLRQPKSGGKGPREFVRDNRHYRNHLPLSYCSQRRLQVPRPAITWLPRLPEIRGSVKHSARSHYEREDIERLFELSEFSVST